MPRFAVVFVALLIAPASASAYSTVQAPEPWTLTSKHLTAQSTTVKVSVSTGGCVTFDHFDVVGDPAALTLTAIFNEIVVAPGEAVPPCVPPHPQVEKVDLHDVLGARVIQDGSSTPATVRFAGILACPSSRNAISDSGPARSRFVTANPRRALLCRYGPASSPGLIRQHYVNPRKRTRALGQLFNAVPIKPPSSPPTSPPCPSASKDLVLTIFVRKDRTNERVSTGFDGCPAAAPTGGGNVGKPGDAVTALLQRLRKLTT